MLGAYVVGAVQVGDGSRDLENPVMGTGRESHLANGHFERPLARIIEGTQFAQLLHRDIRIAKSARVLNGASLGDAAAHFTGARPDLFAAQFLIGYGRNFDMQIDAIEQRPADLAEIALNGATGASTVASWIPEKSATAPVQIATDTA